MWSLHEGADACVLSPQSFRSRLFQVKYNDQVVPMQVAFRTLLHIPISKVQIVCLLPLFLLLFDMPQEPFPSLPTCDSATRV